LVLAQDTVDFSASTETPGSGGDSLPFDAEESLLQSLRNHEERGYETLVRRYGPQVMAIAVRYLRSSEDAADCFQDTFVAVFRSIESFQQRSSIRQWVRGVTINQCLMKLRHRQRRREESIEHMLPMFDERGNRIEAASPGQIAAAGELLDAEQLRQSIRDGIDKLPDSYRVIVLLRDIDGYSTIETASILGIEINAAKTRLHRARSALKFLLEPILERTDRHVDL
jgi:RNA polymerase sigma-70 factor (ECF subfamily)